MRYAEILPAFTIMVGGCAIEPEAAPSTLPQQHPPPTPKDDLPIVFSEPLRTIALARENSADQKTLRRIEEAVLNLQKQAFSQFAIQCWDRFGRSQSKWRWPYDSETCQAIARAIGEEQNSDLRRIYLALLQRHASFQDLDRNPPLDDETVSRLVTLYPDLDERSQMFLLGGVGHYHLKNRGARELLEEVIRDLAQAAGCRVTALAMYGAKPLTSEKLALAEWLFEVDENPGVRTQAISFLGWWQPETLKRDLRPRVSALLEKLVQTDEHGEVRAQAGQALLHLGDCSEIDFVARALERESTPSVRAAVMKDGFAWFYDDPAARKATREFAMRVFESDPDEGVRREAALAFLDRLLSEVSRYEWKTDSETLADAARFAGAVRRKKLSSETKRAIREKLEREFEKPYPGLRFLPAYAQLKQYLKP